MFRNIMKRMFSYSHHSLTINNLPLGFMVPSTRPLCWNTHRGGSSISRLWGGGGANPVWVKGCRRPTWVPFGEDACKNERIAFHSGERRGRGRPQGPLPGSANDVPLSLMTSRFLPDIPFLVSNMSSSLWPFRTALMLCVVPSPTTL